MSEADLSCTRRCRFEELFRVDIDDLDLRCSRECFSSFFLHLGHRAKFDKTLLPRPSVHLEISRLECTSVEGASECGR